MSVVNSNLVIYVSANMPESNSGLTGGAIDSGVRATYEDITSPSQIVSYSSNNSDNQSGTITGRTSAGIIVSENIALSGTGYVTTAYSYERILKYYLNSIGSGTVTVSGNGVNKIADIPVGESGFCRPFYDVIADSSENKTYYEKLFVKNNNPINTLSSANLIEVPSGVYQNVKFGIENTKKSTQSVANREIEPSFLLDHTGVGQPWGNGPLEVVGATLPSTDYQGFWLKLELTAGQTAEKSFYEIQVSGTTV
tara:strand:+ start:2776 stop:3534 length:759 start_codon:yes stop_codon:yes gene_type:complete